ncbi:MAG: mannose-1-phosphate guanylyltransferase [Pirellulaceae bacterium]
MLHAVIMAGGSGTRFWPESRNQRPKQLLQLAGRRTMMQATVQRLGDLVSPERTLIVTNRRLVAPIAEQLPQLPAASFVGEPCKRDTAPCIGLAALLVSRHDDDATMAVMPADHLIQPDDAFRDAIEYAARLVEQHPQRIVTFGIRPSYPAETFGYIQRGEPLETGEAAAPAAYRAARFREKPSAETARQYLASGDFYWNSGIFVWKAKTILAALAENAPEIYTHLEKIAAALGRDDYEQTLEHEFAAIPGKSIDFAVMEHYDDVAVVEAPFEWDDVGNWTALARLLGADDAGNTVVGRHIGIDTTGSIIRTSDDHVVVTVGLDDFIVVHTPDATLIAPRDREESLREIVRRIAERGWDEHL